MWYQVGMRRKLLYHSLRVGISFGVTSGSITTLGLLVGLSAGTSSRPAVLGGIFTIAVADSLSDALGIHASEESEGIHGQREVWTATVATFRMQGLRTLHTGALVLDRSPYRRAVHRGTSLFQTSAIPQALAPAARTSPRDARALA